MATQSSTSSHRDPSAINATCVGLFTMEYHSQVTMTVYSSNRRTSSRILLLSRVVIMSCFTHRFNGLNRTIPWRFLVPFIGTLANSNVNAIRGGTHLYSKELPPRVILFNDSKEVIVHMYVTRQQSRLILRTSPRHLISVCSKIRFVHHVLRRQMNRLRQHRQVITNHQ